MKDLNRQPLPPYTARIERHGNLYIAEATNPRRPAWKSPKPMTAQEIYDALKANGHHQIDIMEAFEACDPDWGERNPNFRT